VKYITLSFTLPQAKHILSALENYPISGATMRRRGIVSMFRKSIARVEEDESSERAFIESGDL
jgi:hypothetical protein